jgi:PTH1 family peptidyl-tRNA hydrolase
VKYLIVGLGNIGDEYQNTRHNIGFRILDALARVSNISFKDIRYGAIAEMKHAGRTFLLLKPSTYMNLSGRAVNYWMQKEKIPVDRVLIIVDDLALPLGTIRLRAKGSDAGHNGLKNINQILGRQDYARLRFGIGDDFHRGQQINHVLGEWTLEEEELVNKRVNICVDAVKAFGTIGIQRTMSEFNNK